MSLRTYMLFEKVCFLRIFAIVDMRKVQVTIAAKSPGENLDRSMIGWTERE